MISMDKKYKTKDGHSVELITVNGRGGFPVIGYIGDNKAIFTWDLKGNWCHPLTESPSDLVEVRSMIKKEGWINIYPKDCGNLYSSREQADYFSRCFADPESSRRVACVKVVIDCEEGEGLDE